jgi:murein DD-endopeptidase MepM/ murein hydrolase activator NlpD
VRRLIVASILIGLAVALVASPATWARKPARAKGGGTGGFAYQPLPNQARPVNPGSIPGESGGASYVPRAERKPRQGSGQGPAAAPIPGGDDLKSGQLHRFPVAGRHSFGGEDARFGARRPGHWHQGQDILADEGSPVVAPRGGTITWRGFQAQGAGYYLVLEAVMEPYTYVFMHLQKGSVQAKVGDRVRTGQTLGAVGSTGTSSAPHLHFEVWRGRWYKGGEPIDPLPYLLAWDAIS